MYQLSAYCLSAPKSTLHYFCAIMGWNLWSFSFATGMTLCQQRVLEGHSRGKGVFLLVLVCLFPLLSLLSPAGWPAVSHTFPWWARDWLQFSGCLSTTLLMQTAASTRTTPSVFPSTSILLCGSREGIFCSGTVGWLSPSPIYKVLCHPMG